MDSKPLLYGIIGFLLGGLLVSVAATTFDKPASSMEGMTASLQGKQGDEFDQAFITNMIEHHEGAVAMAKLSAGSAKHKEIKDLSKAIITAQEKEITEMKQRQKEWGYSDAPAHDTAH